MFSNQGIDITKDIVLNQLINETIQSEKDHYLWVKTELKFFIEYKYEVKLNDTMNLVFKILKYKKNENHMILVYLSKRNGTLKTNIFSLDNKIVKELIKIIEEFKKYKESDKNFLELP